MISLKELNPKGYTLTTEQATNLAILHVAINVIRAAWNKPMVVTSGVRSIEHHRRIYLDKAKAKGITNPRIPMGSRHLTGQAVDIHDPNGDLKRWLTINVALLARAGLYCEDFAHTPTWLHFQTVPPKSGKRFFIP